MRISLAAFTDRGMGLAVKIAQGLEQEGDQVLDCRRIPGNPKISLREWTDKAFQGDALIFVGACGIAVRAIAPLVKDKFADPAVVSIDEGGHFAIPLLSGHMGGGNRLANRVAQIAGGQAAISTATDLNGVFAVDLWAKSQGLYMKERELAKQVSARLLSGEPVGFRSDFPVEGPLPQGFTEKLTELGIQVGFYLGTPFPQTLHLIPKKIALGVGCRKGISFSQFQGKILEFLRQANLPLEGVEQVATISHKGEEPCILEFCQRYGLPLRLFSPQELAQQLGQFTSSDFVRRTVGVDNVCERAAAAACQGALLLPKQAGDGVTAAAAAGPVSLWF